MTADGRIFLPPTTASLNGGGLGHASAFRSTEAVGSREEQSRRKAEDASEACCPGGDGMEVGKGQQAGARNELRRRGIDTTAVTPPAGTGKGAGQLSRPALPHGRILL